MEGDRESISDVEREEPEILQDVDPPLPVRGSQRDTSSI